MIGDSITDIEAGHNFGIKTIAVGQSLKNADFCFSDLYQTAQYIMNLRSIYGNHENTF